MSDSILLHIDGGLARVTFNRPAFLNAMDFEMGARWRDIAAAVTTDEAVGAVILDAAGPAFCAGGDVVAMATSGAAGSDVTATAHVIHEGIRTFALSAKPIVRLCCFCRCEPRLNSRLGCIQASGRLRR